MRERCPKCNWFLSEITGYGNEIRGLYKVEGTCKKHGLVDVTETSESGWDDFFSDYGEADNEKES